MKAGTASRPVPSRLAVYQALCDLSPAAYAPRARWIVGFADDDRANQARRRQRRRPGNIAKPVITTVITNGRDEREGA